MLRILLLSVITVFTLADSASAQYTGIPSPAYADSLFTAGKHDLALVAYKRLLSTDENNYEYRFRLGLLLGWNGDYREAEVLLGSLHREFPEDIDVAAALIRVISWQEYFRRALTITNTMLAKYPDNLEFRELRVQLTFWRGELRRASELADELAVTNPDSEIVLLVQQAVKQSMRTQSTSMYTYAWDAERTRQHVFSQLVQAGLLPGTLLNARTDYAFTKNTFTNTDGDAIRFSLGASHIINRTWFAQASLGGTYITGQKTTLTPSAAITHNIDPLRTTLSITRYLLTDTPALISNKIYQTEAQLGANYRLIDQEINFRLNHAWLSDKNRRFQSTATYSYTLRTDLFEYTPGVIAEYRSFEKSGFSNGYFAPEWQIWGALTQQLRYDFIDETLYGIVSAQMGMQQIQLHGLPKDDPSIKYELGILIGYQPFQNWETELSYRYTNLAGISAQASTQDFWAQVLRFTVRGSF